MGRALEVALEVTLGSDTDATAPPARLFLEVTVSGISVFSRASAPRDGAKRRSFSSRWDLRLDEGVLCRLGGVAAADIAVVGLEIHLFDADSPGSSYGSHFSTIGALLGERRRRLMLTGSSLPGPEPTKLAHAARSTSASTSNMDALNHIALQRASLPLASGRRPPSARRHFDFGRAADGICETAATDALALSLPSRVNPSATTPRRRKENNRGETVIFGQPGGVRAATDALAPSLPSRVNPRATTPRLVPCGDSVTTAAPSLVLPAAPEDQLSTSTSGAAQRQRPLPRTSMDATEEPLLSRFLAVPHEYPPLSSITRAAAPPLGSISAIGTGNGSDTAVSLPSAPSDATREPTRSSSTVRGPLPPDAMSIREPSPPLSHSEPTVGTEQHVQSTPPPPGDVPLRPSRRSVSGDEATSAVRRQQGSIASASGAVATSLERLVGTSPPSPSPPSGDVPLRPSRRSVSGDEEVSAIRRQQQGGISSAGSADGAVATSLERLARTSPPPPSLPTLSAVSALQPEEDDSVEPLSDKAITHAASPDTCSSSVTTPPMAGAGHKHAPRSAALPVSAHRMRSAVPHRRAATSLGTAAGLTDSLEATVDMHDIDRAYGTSLLEERMSMRISEPIPPAPPVHADEAPVPSAREPARVVRKGSYLHEEYPIDDTGSANAGGATQPRNAAFVERRAGAAAEARAAEEARLAAMDAEERTAHDEAAAAKVQHESRKDKMLAKTMKGYKSSARSKILGGRAKARRRAAHPSNEATPGRAVGDMMRQEGLRPAKPMRGRVSQFDLGELQTSNGFLGIPNGSPLSSPKGTLPGAPNSFLGIANGSPLTSPLSSPKGTQPGAPRERSATNSPLTSPRGTRGPAPGPPKVPRPKSADGKQPSTSARRRRAPPTTPHPSDASRKSGAAVLRSVRKRSAPPTSPHPSGRPKPQPPRHLPPAKAERAPRARAKAPPPPAQGGVEASGESTLYSSCSDSEEDSALGGEYSNRFCFAPFGRCEASGESASDSEAEYGDSSVLRLRAVDDDDSAPPGLDSPPSSMKSGAPALVMLTSANAVAALQLVTLELYLLHCRFTSDEQDAGPDEAQMHGRQGPAHGVTGRRETRSPPCSALQSGVAVHSSRRSTLPKATRQRLNRQRSLDLLRESDTYHEAIGRPQRPPPASSSASTSVGADVSAGIGATHVLESIHEGAAPAQRSPTWQSRASLLFPATLEEDDVHVDVIDDRPVSQIPPAGGAPRSSQAMPPPRAPRLEAIEPLHLRSLSALDNVCDSVGNDTAEAATASALTSVRDELRHARLLLAKQTAAKQDLEDQMVQMMRMQQEQREEREQQEQLVQQELPELELEQHGSSNQEQKSQCPSSRAAPQSRADAEAQEPGCVRERVLNHVLEPLPPIATSPTPTPRRRDGRRAARQRRASSVASGMRATVMTPAVRKRLKARRTSTAHADADFAMLLAERAKTAGSSGVAPGPVTAPPAPDPGYLDAMKEMARQRRDERRAALFDKPCDAPRETPSNVSQSSHGGRTSAAPLQEPRREVATSVALPAKPLVEHELPKLNEPRSTRRAQRERAQRERARAQANDTRVPADHARELTLGNRAKELARIDTRARRAEEVEDEHLRRQVCDLQRSVESLRKEYAAAQLEARAEPFPIWRASPAPSARSAVSARTVLTVEHEQERVPVHSVRHGERTARRAAEREAKRAELVAALAHQRVVREVIERSCWREWSIDRSTRAGRAIRGPATYWCNDVTGESAWAPPALSRAAAEAWRTPDRRRAIAAEMERGAVTLEAERAQHAADDSKLRRSQKAELKQGIELATLRHELRKLRAYHTEALLGPSAGASESARGVRVLELEATVRQHRVHAALAVAAALRRALARRGAPDVRAAFAHLAHVNSQQNGRQALGECPWCRRAARVVARCAAQKLVDATRRAIAHAARERERASERASANTTLRREALQRGWRTTRARTVAHVDPAFASFLWFRAALSASPAVDESTRSTS